VRGWNPGVTLSPEAGEVPDRYKAAIDHRSDLKILAIDPPT